MSSPALVVGLCEHWKHCQCQYSVGILQLIHNLDYLLIQSFKINWKRGIKFFFFPFQNFSGQMHTSVHAHHLLDFQEYIRAFQRLQLTSYPPGFLSFKILFSLLLSLTCIVSSGSCSGK